MKTKTIFFSIVLSFFFFGTASAETKTLNAVADTYTDSTRPTYNFGNSFSLNISSGRSQNASSQQGYLKFNINSFVPLGSTVQKAYLKLYNYRPTCSGMVVKVFRVTQNWSELGINYQNAPGFSGNDGAQATLLVDEGNSGRTTWDVTNITKGWVENAYLNYGFRIYYYTAEPDCLATFFSRESQYKPGLEITYTPPADQTAPSISQITENTGTTRATIGWHTQADPSTGTISYKKKTDLIWRVKSETGSPLIVHSLALENLLPDMLYQYKITAKDAAGNRSISATMSFRTLPLEENNRADSNQGSEDQNSGEQLQVYNIIKDVQGPSSARIKWWSNISGTSWVLASDIADDNTANSEYTPYGRNDDESVHEVLVDELQPGTTYSFKVLTRTADNQVAVSARQTFTTYEQNEPENDDQTQPANASSDEGVDNGQNSDSKEADPEILDEILEQADLVGISQSGENNIESGKENVGGNKESNSNDFKNENPSRLDNFLFYSVRMVVPLFIFFSLVMLGIILIIKKRREKKDLEPNNVPTTSALADNSISANVAPKTKKRTILWVVVIIGSIFMLILLKNILTFFIPLPF